MFLGGMRRVGLVGLVELRASLRRSVSYCLEVPYHVQLFGSLSRVYFVVTPSTALIGLR